MTIIPKLMESGLTGRGGGGFPTGKKWGIVKKAKGDKKYIVCNGSEGEPGVFKDRYILEKYPEEVIEGIKIALKTFPNSSAYIFLNKNYYKKFKTKLKSLTKNLPITLFKKTGGYLSGEETVLLNEIQKETKYEPRLKPPYPTQSGLFNQPTLINNVETFYYIAQVAKDKYKQTRFYSISGDIPNKGVFELPISWSAQKILKETGNFPAHPFFVQTGGGAMGEVLLPKELNQKVEGAGAIIIYDKKKTDSFKLMEKWAKFFLKGNCDKCVPCREGVYRINEMVRTRKIDCKILSDLFFVMEQTSFCPLGKGATLPFKSLCNKLQLL